VKFTKSTRDWESVEIDLQEAPEFPGYIFDCGLRGNIQLETWKHLQTLSLFSGWWDGAPPEGEGSVECGALCMTQESFPMLRNVTLQLKCCCVILRWKLPWSQLTTLTLGMLVDFCAEYLDVLSWCGNLRTFHLHRSDWRLGC
jgi:hypothetical protein